MASNWWNDNSSAVLSAGSGVLSGGLSSLFSWINAKQQRKFASEEAQKQRDWQEQMWHKENEYNTPANQANRLRAAGFNPYAMGDVDSTSMSVGSGSTASTPPTTPIDFGFIHDSVMSALSAKRMDSEIKSIDENTRSTFLDNVRKEFENGNLKEVYEYYKAQLDADLEEKRLSNSEYEVRVKALQLAYDQAKEADDAGINPHVDAHNESVQRVEQLKQSISNMKVDNAVKSFALETSKLYDRAFLQLDYQARKKEVEEFLDTSEVRVSLYNAQKSFAKLANDAATRADALDAITNETELIIAERILDAAKDGSTAFDAVLLRLLSSDPVNTLSAIQNLIPNVQVTNKNYSNTNLRIKN